MGLLRCGQSNRKSEHKQPRISPWNIRRPLEAPAAPEMTISGIRCYSLGCALRAQGKESQDRSISLRLSSSVSTMAFNSIIVQVRNAIAQQQQHSPLSTKLRCSSCIISRTVCRTFVRYTSNAMLTSRWKLKLWYVIPEPRIRTPSSLSGANAWPIRICFVGSMDGHRDTCNQVGTQRGPPVMHLLSL